MPRPEFGSAKIGALVTSLIFTNVPKKELNL